MLFFDLDGTLTDPKEGITASIQYALRGLGETSIPHQDELTWCIGPPLRGSFVQMLDADRADEAVTLYREHFATTGLFQNRVYGGIDTLLRSLRAQNRQLCVASSKPRVYVEQILRHFSLDHYFAQVFGSELDGTRADKGELLSYALAQTGSAAADSVMIGDRQHDVHGAALNQMDCIGVLYGYGSRDELTDAGAKHLVDNPAQLLQLLTR
ncbi:MAG: HAD family hydrolase [Pseudomonadota bacterium]